MGSRTLCLTIWMAASAFSAPRIPGLQNHWVANSNGTPFGHIQNFIEDMTVLADGSVLTQSFYDEGLHPNSIYKDGAYSSPNWYVSESNPHPSRNATYHGRTWTIRNFHGRSFLFKNHPPPRGDSAPLIVSSAGDTIRSVEDPTALAFDSLGRLWVGDNGPDQDIKIFQVPTPEKPGLPIQLVRTFGEQGGVFAQPRGRIGPKRFWGIRGLGIDARGRLYVGCTGMPMQVAAGTHIRAFSDTTAGATLLWEIMGLAFVSGAEADPHSDSGALTGGGSTDIYKNAERFRMDWSQPPGKSWSFTSATLDPFKYPDDPRLWMPTECISFRRIQGKRFLFLNNMGGDFLAIFRFEDGNSDIAVPAVFLPLTNPMRDSTQQWAWGKRPIWGPYTQSDDRRWMWRDANGDGQVTADEFITFQNPFPYFMAWDVDDSGDIWTGGGPKMVNFPFGGLDSRGVPIYDPAQIKTRTVPYNQDNRYVMSFRYLRNQDVMVLSSGQFDNKMTTLYRYDRWSEYRRSYVTGDTFTMAPTWKVTIPYKFPDSWGGHLDPTSIDTCLLATSMTADSEYIYVGYGDKGPDSWKNGEISVIRLRDGVRIGHVSPGPETNFLAGWFDIPKPLGVFVRANRERILMAEEDFAGKVNVYRWCPDSTCVAPSLPPPKRIIHKKGDFFLTSTKGGLEIFVDSDVDWHLTLYSLRGQLTRSYFGRGSQVLKIPREDRISFSVLRANGKRSIHSTWIH